MVSGTKLELQHAVPLIGLLGIAMGLVKLLVLLLDLVQFPACLIVFFIISVQELGNVVVGKV